VFYITTPIPYVNGDPHLGHLFEEVFNDCIARYRRRKELTPVLLSMGLDQHGQKNYEKAIEDFCQKNKLSLEQFLEQKSQSEILDIIKNYVDKNSDKFKELSQKFEISYDIFIETSSPKHKAICEIVWHKLVTKNLIYKKSYRGLYCKGCEDFKTNSQLNSDNKCPLHPNLDLVQFEEENYFFRLNQFEKKVENFLESLNLKPETQKKEWQNFVKNGLTDISVSREKSKLPWGVEVPNDKNQVMYIWFEALLSYLTTVVDEESIDKYLELPLQKKEFEEEIWSQIQLGFPIDFMYVSKEIAKFHLIIFPAILLALDLPLPTFSLVHGLINDSLGRKFSKSLENGIYPHELIEKFGIDGSRFALLFNINNVEDTAFSWYNLIESYNSNLANNLGNLLSRVTNLIEKHLNGIIDLDNLDFLEKENTIKFPDFSLKDVYQELEEYNPQKSLQNLFLQTDLLNKFLEETKPWSLAKDLPKNEIHVQQILTFCAKSLFEIGKAVSIFMPQTGQKICEILQNPKITKSEILFCRVELDK
jgi:methionyl-tRNA synthetase